jgi:hypothetical protein
VEGFTPIGLSGTIEKQHLSMGLHAAAEWRRK